MKAELKERKARLQRKMIEVVQAKPGPRREALLKQVAEESRELFMEGWLGLDEIAEMGKIAKKFAQA